MMPKRENYIKSLPMLKKSGKINAPVEDSKVIRHDDLIGGDMETKEVNKALEDIFRPK